MGKIGFDRRGVGKRSDEVTGLWAEWGWWVYAEMDGVMAGVLAFTYRRPPLTCAECQW